MSLLFTVFTVSPLRSAMLSIIAKPITASSTVPGTLMMPKRQLLDSLAWGNISPAKTSARKKCPTPANRPQQELGEPRDPSLK